MQPIDWLVMTVPIIAVACIALYVRRFVKSVADFMAGGRNAGRFLLCTAKSGMGAGAVSYVAGFEVFSHGGFSYNWWNQITPPLLLLVTISGFVIYRYRETRALTLGQFFEMRYSRRFRLFAGMMGFFAGLVNFGVMPLVNGKFMAYFLGFPETVSVFGHPVQSYLICMAINLTLTASITMLGGQITVLVADCLEGLFSQMSYVVITIVVLVMFSWPDARHLLMSAPKGHSMVNPFDSFGMKDFNIWYVVMAVMMTAYTTMAWQNQHAFNASGSSPHEARMGGILGNWRTFAGDSMKYMLVLFALCYISSPHGSAAIHPVLDHISSDTTRKQMEIPIALSQRLPMGIRGLFVAVLLMGVFAADGMHLHSWSSIFIQDIVMPLRKTPLSRRQHLILLRAGVVGVALVIFLFGVFFDPGEYMVMWWALTEAIFTGGAGACIIGGLYWSRGTSAGAWTASIVGFICCFGGLMIRQMYIPLVTTWLPHVGLGSAASAFHARFATFPLNPRVISFYGCIIAMLSYVVVSLLTCRKPFNMDRLLHRGQYAVEGNAIAEPGPMLQPRRKRVNLLKLFGITDEFTLGDRFIALGIFGWQFLWLAVFVVGSAWYLFIHKWSDETWTTYWIITSIYLPLALAVVTTIWFTWGVSRDLRVFIRRLKTERVDTHDDGTVRPRDAAEAAPIPASAPALAAADTLLVAGK
jgi:SSS family solute:Na+ symporter